MADPKPHESWLEDSARRSNPCIDLEADLFAIYTGMLISHAGKAFTQEAKTLTGQMRKSALVDASLSKWMGRLLSVYYVADFALKVNGLVGEKPFVYFPVNEKLKYIFARSSKELPASQQSTTIEPSSHSSEGAE